MRLLGKLKIRQKFLLILVPAILLPFASYTFFINYALEGLDEIERSQVDSELLQSESQIRNELKTLQSLSVHLASHSDTLKWLSEADQSSRDSIVKLARLLQSTQVDLVYAMTADGKLHDLIASSTAENDSNRPDLINLINHPLASEGIGGFTKLGAEPFLVSVYPVIKPGEKTPLGWIISGTHYIHSLSSHLTGQRQSTITLSSDVAAKDNRNDIRTEYQDTPSGLKVKKSRLGLFKKDWFHLELHLENGLLDRVRSQLVWVTILFAVLVGVTSFVAIAFATRIVITPVRSLVRVMGTIHGPESYSERVQMQRSDEIGELAKSFNLLMERLERAHQNLEEARQQIIEQEKLNTLHATVVTLAHQINNPLTTLIGKVELLLFHEELPEETRQSLETIREMSLRIAEVIRRLQEVRSIQITPYLRNENMLNIGVFNTGKTESEPDPPLVS